MFRNTLFRKTGPAECPLGLTLNPGARAPPRSRSSKPPLPPTTLSIRFTGLLSLVSGMFAPIRSFSGKSIGSDGEGIRNGLS